MISCNGLSQETINSQVDKTAQFPGGQKGLVNYLSTNIRVPEIAEELGISGKVYVQFVIDKKGKVSNSRIIQGMDKCPECGEEVIRVVNAMPKWKPAKNDGKKVASYYTLPVVFNIQ